MTVTIEDQNQIGENQIEANGHLAPWSDPGGPRRASSGENTRRFDHVLSCFLPRFKRIAFRKLRNPADAEDAVQDALLAAYKHLDQFEGHSQMSTWLTSIVMNCSRMQLRRKLRHIYVSLDDPVGAEQDHSLSDQIVDAAPGPEREYRDVELYEQAIRAMKELGPSLRMVLQLRYLEGCTIREAALILDVPKATVKARLFRARAQLRARMSGRPASGAGSAKHLPRRCTRYLRTGATVAA